VAVALILSAFGLPSAGRAAADRFSFTGPGAEAFFFTVDGCVETSVGLHASDSFRHDPPGPPTIFSSVFVSVGVFDACTLTTLRSGFAFAVLPPSAFQANNRLTSASLNTTVNVPDFVSNRSFALSIDLTWVGTGEVQRVSDHVLEHFPTFMLNRRLTSMSRDAVATGSVSDGTRNLTPDPSVTASIDDVAGGGVSVGFKD